MPIAISVQSAPSRSRTLLMAIVAIAFIGIGTIAFLSFSEGFSVISLGIALCGIGLAVFACSVLRTSNSPVRLTIAENGQLSLVLQRKERFPVAKPAEIVQMMPGSTLWPFFILLRLRLQNRKMIVVPFFWGDLSPQRFRRLSIACRWIASRTDAPQSVFQTGSD
jgi:toxin CptA